MGSHPLFSVLFDFVSRFGRRQAADPRRRRRAGVLLCRPSWHPISFYLFPFVCVCVGADDDCDVGLGAS